MNLLRLLPIGMARSTRAGQRVVVLVLNLAQ
jgi:hypothetical protein